MPRSRHAAQRRGRPGRRDDRHAAGRPTACTGARRGHRRARARHLGGRRAQRGRRHSTRLSTTTSVAGSRCSIVLASVVVGGVIGAAAASRGAPGGAGRAPCSAGCTRGRAHRRDARRFVEGYVTASLVFCVGPLTVLGSLQDGIGRRDRAARPQVGARRLRRARLRRVARAGGSSPRPSPFWSSRARSPCSACCG